MDRGGGTEQEPPAHQDVPWLSGRWLGSIRVRILAVVATLLLLSSIGSVLLLRALLLDQLAEEVELDLDQETEEFRLLSAGNDPETGEPFDGDLEAIFDVYFAREVPDEGESLLAFIDGELHASSRAADAAAVDTLGQEIEYWLSLDELERGSIETTLGEARYVALPLDGNGADGLFVVANFPAFERAEINDAVQRHVVVQTMTLVVASLLGLVLAGRVLRPLRSLTETARGISDTDLSQRIAVTGKDEASDIAATFNAMLNRLERSFITQRQFLDETSHELRTPLTIMRGHLELIELADSPEERRETIALVLDELDRTAELVEALFMLARSQTPDFVQLVTMDAADVVAEVQRKATALARRDWRLETSGRVPVRADRSRLVQAMLQLAGNAVKFTDDGAVIRIGAAVVQGTARIWVDDTGSGVAPGDEERIFQRFQRGELRADGDGAGLGLAIVQAIVEAHGGGIRLVPRRGPGARFEITLPLHREG